MTWFDVMIFSGLTFIIGCCIGTMVEIQRKRKELNRIWRLHRESERINREMQDVMMAQIETLEDINRAQHNLIEALAERNEGLSVQL